MLNIVTGTGPGAGEPIGLHPGIDMVSFTGSTETGRRFLRYSADSNLKKVVLECGGKNPAIVMDDAENLDLVAEHLVNGAFWNMGENCSATSRLIVHEDVREALMPKILARVRDWRMGDPLDPSNHLGSLIDDEHCAKVSGYLADAGKVSRRWSAARSRAIMLPRPSSTVWRRTAVWRQKRFSVPSCR